MCAPSWPWRRSAACAPAPRSMQRGGNGLCTSSRRSFTREEPMADDEHHRKLERLYAKAPVSRWYGATIAIDDARAEVRIAVRPEFHHAANAVHGSVYFRALDDAAFFAANSRVRDVLVLTVSYT